MIQSEKKNFYCIDLFKYIMALAVVTIHTGAININYEYPPIVVWFIRSAVPFFFIVSGFFIARKLYESKTKEKRQHFLRKRAIQLIRIFSIWLIIYFPLSVYYYVKNDFSLIQSILSYCTSIIFFGESPYSWPLWFIYSLSIVTFLLSFTYNKNFKKFLILVALLSYLSNYFVNYTELDSFRIIKLFNMLLGRTFGGGIYILTGIYLYKFISRGHLDYKNSCFIVISALLLSMILFYYKLPFWELGSGLGFVMMGLYINLRVSSFWKKLRIQSMWIYYSHMYVIVIMWIIFPDLLQNYYIIFIASVYLVSIILAYLLYRIQMIHSCSKIGNLIR